MSDGNISQEDIDSILSSLTGEMDGGGGSDATSEELAGLDSLPVEANNKKTTTKKTEEGVDTENIPLLLDVKMKLSVVLGNSRKPIGQVLELGKGSVVELDRFVGDDVDVYINDQLIGKGEIMALDDEYGIKITKILTPIAKLRFSK